MGRFIGWFRRNKINFIVLFISLILTLGILEFVNYLTVSKIDHYYVWPPELSKTFIPDPNVMKGIKGESRFTINRLGYRGPMIRSDNEYRILTVGGSTTEGLYLDDSETWPHLIMEKLGKNKDGEEVIVMNIGKSGFNTRDHIIQLKHLTKDYDPDLIIIMTGVNDMLYKLSKRWVWKPFDEENYDYSRVFYETPDFTFKSSLVYKGYKFIDNKFRLSLEPQDKVGESIAKSRLERLNSDSIIHEVPDLGPALEDYENNLNRLIDIDRERGVDTIFLTQPYLWKNGMSKEEDSSLWMSTDFNGNYYAIDVMIESMDKFNEKLLEVCVGKRAVYCFDLEKEIEKSNDYFYDDVHFNEKGAEAVAELFSIYIKENIKEFQERNEKTIYL